MICTSPGVSFCQSALIQHSSIGNSRARRTTAGAEYDVDCCRSALGSDAPFRFFIMYPDLSLDVYHAIYTILPVVLQAFYPSRPDQETQFFPNFASRSGPIAYSARLITGFSAGESARYV